MVKFTSSVKVLEDLIANIRNIAVAGGISSTDLDEDTLEIMNLGFSEGLCSSAMIIAQQIDLHKGMDPDHKDSRSKEEMKWWNNLDDGVDIAEMED